MRYEWTANWQPLAAPDQHIARIDLNGTYYMFGYPFIRVNSCIHQIGPAIVHLEVKLNTNWVNCFIIQTIIPLAPMKHKVIHLSLSDSLPAYGPITDMTFSLARNGVSFFVSPNRYLCSHLYQDRPVPELVAATGAGHLGGFTLFQVHLELDSLVDFLGYLLLF